MGLIGFWVLRDWLVQRTGPDFEGTPGQLVPANAALVARWPEAARFVDQASRLETTRALLGDSGLAELLLPPAPADSSSREGRSDSASADEAPPEATDARHQATRALAKKFVDTCLGGEAVVAVLPPLESAAPDARADATSATSALLIVTRSNAGFDENLAEFVAECYPELALETRLYRGSRLQRYNAQKTRHAFGYCRFGTTVALVLRSADWRRLEAVVDQRMEAERAGAAAAPAGSADQSKLDAKHAWPGETPPWLAAPPTSAVADGAGATAILYCDPRALPAALETLPAGGSARKGAKAETPGLTELLAIWCPETAYLTATLTVGKDGLHLDTLWHSRAAGNAVAPETADPISNYLGTLPPSSPICVAVAWPELGARVRTTYELWVREVWGKDVKDFESAWRKATQMRFDREFLPQLDGFAGLGVTGVAENALLPLPRARMALRLNGPPVARTTSPASSPLTEPSPDSAGAATLTMLGILASMRDGDWLRLGLNESPNPLPSRAAQAGGTAKTLLGQALLAQPPALPEGAPALSALLLADLDAVAPMLERTLAAMGLWSKNARRDAGDWQANIDLLRHLHGLRLRAWREGENVRMDLLVPMD